MQLSDEEAEADQKLEQVPMEELTQIKKEKKSKKDKKKKKRKHRQLDNQDLGDGAVDNIDELTCLDNEQIKNLSTTDLDAKIKQLEKQEHTGDNDYKVDENEAEGIDDEIDKIDQELKQFNNPLRKITKAELIERENQEDQKAKSKMGPEGAERFDMICQQLAQAKRGGKIKHKDSILTANLTVEESIKQLDDQMEDALLKDIESNKQKKPAFLRLLLLCKIDTTLRKLNLQEDFLEKDGCQRLSDWLKPMPDNTYPNQKIILSIMGCVDRLPISQDQLKDTDLENSLEVYRNGQAGPGYIECQKLAKNIMDKWYREKYHIQTTYDSAGQFDQGWAKFQKHLEKERAAANDGNEGSGDEDKSKKNQVDGQKPIENAENVTQFLAQNHRQRQLNFTERPPNVNSRSLEGSNRRRVINVEQNVGWQKLKKTLAGFKKKAMEKKTHGGMQHPQRVGHF